MTMDKLFNVSCAAELVRDGLSAAGAVDDSVLHSALEAISKSQTVLLPQEVFGLRTRPPRRLSVAGSA
jgi:hypothetical protein